MKQFSLKKLFTILSGIVFSCLFLITIQQTAGCKCGVDGISSATPVAVQRSVPAGLKLNVTGKVKDNYAFNSNSFAKLAATRIRTREVSPSGEMLGAYIYTGVPVIFFLEGIAPVKTKEDAFDRPLDMLVTFKSASGKEVVFSYGELTMTDDRFPVILAYHREELLPSKEPEKYTKNKFKGNIKGLKLICPRETDTSRYLEDVVEMALTIPELPDLPISLPVMRKGQKCSSDKILCVSKEASAEAIYDDVERVAVKNWFRIGHGRGMKGKSLFTAEGFSVPSFLEKNFPGCGADDFFLFIACDGYRCVFSGREIFCTSDGDSMMLMELINGKPPRGGKTLTAADDFFVDRNIWGLSHVVFIAKQKAN